MGYPDLPVFLGVGRYKGTWNASTNSGTLATAPVGGYEAHDTTPLFSSGSTHIRNPNALGGYDGGTNLTATLGDFWKVITAGSTPIDGEDTWRVSDFVVFTYNSGSTSGSTWQKLNYTDTVSSIMYGNGSGGSTVFGLSAADVHEFTGSLYVSGALFAEELNTTSHNHHVITSIIEKSGSTTFGDSADDKHAFNGTLTVAGDMSGSGKILNVGGIETQGDLGVTGSATIRGATSFLGGTTFGDASTDTHKFSGSVYVSGNVYAEQFHTTEHNHTVVSTTLHKSGSTTFGNTSGDVHMFTGSVDLGGATSARSSLYVAGNTQFITKTFHTGVLYTSQRIESTAAPIFFRTTSSAQNTLFEFNQAARSFYLTDKSAGNTNYPFLTRDGKVVLGNNAASVAVSHPVTIVGDLSGSGKIFNLAGIETAGDLGVSGTITATSYDSVEATNNISSSAMGIFVQGVRSAQNIQATGTLVGGGILTYGSSNLGNSNDDTHAFTGRVTMAQPASLTDNLDVSGTLTAYGDLDVQKIRSRLDTQRDTYIGFNNGGFSLFVDDDEILESWGTTIGDPYLAVNPNKSDVDFYVNAEGIQKAFFVEGSTSNILITTGSTGKVGIGVTSPSHKLTIAGDISGSGKILNVGGIETQGSLGVTGSATISGSLTCHNQFALTLTSSAGNTHYQYHQSGRRLGLFDVNSGDYVWAIADRKLNLGNSLFPTHTLTVRGDISGSGKIITEGNVVMEGGLYVTGSSTLKGALVGYSNSQFTQKLAIGDVGNKHHLTVAGDISGSGKIFNEGGIETVGSLGVTGSATILGASVINGNSRFASSAQIGYAAAASVTHPLMVSGDISGSGKIFNLGGIETAADLGVTGSVTAGNVMPRTDNTFDLGSASKRWANIYTGDLHLKNDRGDWTIVEEEDYLSVINNKTSKKYKMVLEEIED